MKLRSKLQGFIPSAFGGIVRLANFNAFYFLNLSLTIKKLKNYAIKYATNLHQFELSFW
jgi:hypothetical protein